MARSAEMQAIDEALMVPHDDLTLEIVPKGEAEGEWRGVDLVEMFLELIDHYSRPTSRDQREESVDALSSLQGRLETLAKICTTRKSKIMKSKCQGEAK